MEIIDQHRYIFAILDDDDGDPRATYVPAADPYH